MDNTLLLADDEEGIRKVLGIALADSGYDVLTAADGLEALKVFREARPPIVLTDLKMPGMDGIELLRRIKAERPETEVIMFTGHGDMDLAIMSLKHEATDFVTKPINDEVLEIALKRARERIDLRRQLRGYTERLERLVEEKARRLIEAERMAAVGETVAELAHTIKNIANALTGGIFVLGKGVELDEKEYLHQGWRMVSENVEKIKNLSLEMLNFGKYAALTPQPGDVNAPAADVVRLMAAQAQKQGVELTAELGENLGPVALDAEAIHCCLLNLVSNAIDACRDREGPAGRHRVTVRTRAATGGGVEIEVSDTGCGMDTDVRQRLFQGIFSTKATAGTGIGLMMTKRIVDQHQGSICVESRRGEGSTFTIRLPDLPAGYPESRRPAPPAGKT